VCKDGSQNHTVNAGKGSNMQKIRKMSWIIQVTHSIENQVYVNF